MNAGIKDISWSLFARVGSILIQLITQVCLAWLLGKADRGSYAICLVYASLLGVMFAIGTDMACGYKVASKRFTLSQGVFDCIWISIFVGAIAMLAGWLLTFTSLAFFDKANIDSLHLCLWLIPVNIVSDGLLRLLTVVREFAIYTWLSLIRAGLSLLLLLAMVYGLDWGVTGAIGSQVAAIVISILITMVILRKKCSITWASPSLNRMSELFGYGIRFYFGKLSNSMNVQIGLIIMAFFVSREEIGVFAVSLSLVARVSIIPDSIVEALFPRVASDSKGGRADIVARGARVSLAISGITLAVIALLADLMVWILFPEEFIFAATLLRIMAIGMVIRFGCKVFIPYFTGTDRPGVASIAVGVGVLINGLLIFLLLPNMGLSGAAWAVTIGYVFSSVILLLAFRAYANMSIREIWAPQREDWKPLLGLASRLRRTRTG